MEPPSSIQLGNIWLTVATVTHAAVDAVHGFPAVLFLNPDGALVALRPDHPDYGSSLVKQGFACTIGADSDLARIGARIREAAMAVWDDAP